MSVYKLKVWTTIYDILAKLNFFSMEYLQILLNVTPLVLKILLT